MKKIAIIGAGAAGMMAAVISSENGNEVTIFEKNNMLGKKVYITGKGRCNVTNDSEVENLIKNTVSNPYFLYSAFYTFDSKALINYLNNLGVKTKTERGNRVFPVSEKSSDIIKAFEKKMRLNNVNIKLKTEIKNILFENEVVKGLVTTQNEKYFFDKIIIATGGLSYPATGSTGSGFKFAKETGHKVTSLFPALVPLLTKENWVKELQGLSLKNVSINFLVNNKSVYKDFGEMLFTHKGISGPIVLSGSRFITDKFLNNNIVEAVIDLKPALNEKQLDMRILKDFEKNINKNFANALDELLPQKLIPIIINLSNIDQYKKVNEITKLERKNLIYLLKNLKITITDTAGYKEAVITVGGIDVNQIDPGTMESKLIKGLYFAGEVIDVDAFTGGFNLQIAFSTGFLAGKEVVK